LALIGALNRRAKEGKQWEPFWNDDEYFFGFFPEVGGGKRGG